MTVECLYCGSLETARVDRYKCLAAEDEKYFQDMHIYSCRDCKLGFAHPIPAEKVLGAFYENVYRKEGRIHYIEHPEKVDFNAWINAQFAYVSQFIDLGSIKTVLDVGPGYGFLLREIRRHHPDLRLIGIDPDVSSLRYLNDFGIETQSMLFGTSAGSFFSRDKVDLIISSHSLEHMTNPGEFFANASRILKDDGKIFLEVPNCELIPEGYLNRPYDSPHLLFLSKGFIQRICSDMGWECIHITTAGMPMEEELLLMNEGYSSVRTNNSTGHRNRAVKLIKNILPPRIQSSIRALLYENDSEANSRKSTWPYQYGGNRWTIRALLQKKGN